VDLFNLAVEDRVVFVPGDPFYVDGRRSNALRLNFSCSDENTIDTGMRRLGRAINRLLESSSRPELETGVG
jgi:2-aminoadipate transaminase